MRFVGNIDIGKLDIGTIEEDDDMVQLFASVPVTVYVLVAVGTNAVPFVTLLFHAKLVAVPPPVKITDSPSQIVFPAALELAVTVGAALITTSTSSVAVHPLASVTVTV